MAYSTPIIAAHYAELALKGKNRPVFLRRLINNLRAALANEPVASIDHVESRLLIRLSDPSRAEAAVERMRKVFGLQWVSPAVPVNRDEMGPDLEGVCRVAATIALQDHGEARHFKIETRRSDRTFPITSPEVNRIVGTAVQAAINLPARMAKPDFTLHVLILKDLALVFTRKLSAPGGLPLGTGGRVSVLLSGGIDSPVAAWMLMKRGCKPEFVHFFSGRSPAEADAAKIEELVRILAGFAPHPLNLHLVPVYPYELRAIGAIEDSYDMVVFRRFMVKCSEEIALKTNCLGLVTGDSLGQVASQTLANLGAISSDVAMPILRPLIGMDKIQITDLANRIGTFSTSIQPYRDCCSIRSPHPVLDARAEEVLRFSTKMDLAAAVQEAVASATKITVD